MAQEKSSSREGGFEKGARLYRDFNALAAVAIAGFAVAIPGPNVLLASWAGWNAVQAGGGEIVRRVAKKK